MKIGLIVNPVAGIGGPAGLKGSDGADIQREARRRGYASGGAARVAQALRALSAAGGSVELYAAPGEMGADAALSCGFSPAVTGRIVPGGTTAGDTRRIALELADRGVSLLVFAGGDGTARDICEAVGTELPVLGVPCGVKIHSAVYAVSPRAAGEVLLSFIRGRTRLIEAEVMDIDEALFRQGVVSARLYGYLRVPRDGLMQSTKAASRPDAQALAGLAQEIADRMQPGPCYIMGPGTTIRAVFDRLGLPKTLLGVDVLQDRRLVAADADERRIFELVRERPARIVVTVIGGQGHIFGRGNQQLSPRVLKAVGRENILVAATREKLASLRGGRLLVDTGDPDCDRLLCGYYRVIADSGHSVVCLAER